LVVMSDLCVLPTSECFSEFMVAFNHGAAQFRYDVCVSHD